MRARPSPFSKDKINIFRLEASVICSCCLFSGSELDMDITVHKHKKCPSESDGTNKASVEFWRWKCCRESWKQHLRPRAVTWDNDVSKYVVLAAQSTLQTLHILSFYIM